MASGLQCPGCGHVHPAGLPEIARGDETFRCYGCYRMLSVPEGWTGRSAPRPPAPELAPTGDGPPGAGTRDARSARLAGRAGAGTLTGSSTGAPAGDLPTQMVPPVTATGTAAGNAIGSPLRVGVWVAAFVLGLVVSAFVLRKVGVLSANAVIDLYAGSGLRRFGILVVLLPLWAVLSALIAHFSLEALARRRGLAGQRTATG